MLINQASRHKACTVTFPYSALFFKSPQLQRSVVAVKPIFAKVALSEPFIRTTVFEGWFHVLKRLVSYLTQWPSHLLSQRYRRQCTKQVKMYRRKNKQKTSAITIKMLIKQYFVCVDSRYYFLPAWPPNQWTVGSCSVAEHWLTPVQTLETKRHYGVPYFLSTEANVPGLPYLLNLLMPGRTTPKHSQTDCIFCAASMKWLNSVFCIWMTVLNFKTYEQKQRSVSLSFIPQHPEDHYSLLLSPKVFSSSITEWFIIF